MQIRIQGAKLKRIHADPGQSLRSQKVEFLQQQNFKNVIVQKHTYEDIKDLLKDRDAGLFVNLGQFPCSWIRIRISKYGSGSGSRTSKWMRIRINNTASITEVEKSNNFSLSFICVVKVSFLSIKHNMVKNRRNSLL